MNRRPGKSARSRRVSRPWTHTEAAAAVPYIRSILQSAREHRLEAISQYLRVRRLADRPGRPDRAAMIAQEDASREAARQQRLFEAEIEELDRLGVQCVDPVSGLAVIPFLHDGRAAWYLFELHAAPQLTAWRYHDDPLEVVRRLDELPSVRPTAFFAL
jgi:hypothetical protein